MHAQLLGIGTRFVPPRDGSNAIEFSSNLAFPTWHPENALNLFNFSGIEYNGGSTKSSGMNIKPIQLKTYFSENLYNTKPYTIFAGFDAGYLFNFNGGKDGIVLTPNVSVEYKVFFVNTGWDFNLMAKKNNFYIRVGVGFGLGTFKAIAKTKIR